MTNLSVEDLKRIEAIEKYIAQLHLLVPELKPYQPIDTTEGEPIETEQRWIVEVQPFADHRDDVKIVVTLNDGFIGKQGGKQLAEAIKQYLSANKF